ncbi:50S ribosomal protein L21 [Polaribacter sp. Z014]|uniref:50S ribosomal protein L21 n=1 Tax=unclassified Polaribacter TaxID=196858 RepID=UPI00193C740B|nr:MULTISPECIES: 50S ribosomal protein L21 [unclassified Polaribacter]MCL7761787.1 50S ribosomal protein L21 [Polaribacter sp. Z014]QVY64813.1 50S ribosomal protein L21 [Polaribacter sp. Q13]
MYAIVEMAGQQFKVAKDQKVYVHRLQGEVGSKVTFDNVLLLDEKGNVTIGAPAIEGASVTAQILSHLKGDKVIVFKKKRRKGYIKKNGHRQFLSEILIESIAASGSKKAAPKKEAAPKAKAAPKKSAKADDLKKIEGAGPKAAEALVNAGLDTFAKVAKADPAKLSEILTEASSRLSHLVTTTWPKQAGLAAEGKWDELKELQDRLDGGIEK